MTFAKSLRFNYTNWRGEAAERWATPISVRFGTSEWHRKPQWLMRAFDHDKGEEREFALTDCNFDLETATAIPRNNPEAPDSEGAK